MQKLRQINSIGLQRMIEPETLAIKPATVIAYASGYTLSEFNSGA